MTLRVTLLLVATAACALPKTRDIFSHDPLRNKTGVALTADLKVLAHRAGHKVPRFFGNRTAWRYTGSDGRSLRTSD